MRGYWSWRRWLAEASTPLLLRKWGADVRGQTVLEGLLVLIVLGMLLFGALEIGRAYAVRHSLDAGCWRAARYLSVHPGDQATAAQFVRDEVARNLGGDLAGRVTVTTIPADTGWLGFQEEFTVRATAPWSPLTPIPFLPAGGATLAVEHTLAVERYP